MGQIRRTDRTLVRKCNVFDLYEDTMVTDDGHTAKWDFLKHNGAAAVVAVTAEGKILMVRQYRNAIDRYSLEIPAGKKDSPDEDPYACAKRELEEETGYRSDDLEHLVKVVTAIAYCNETIDIYVARNLKKTAQNLDEDEFIDVEAYEPGKLKEMILNGQLQDCKTVAAISAYLCKYPEEA